MSVHEPLSYQFFEAQLAPQLEVFGGPDFFPAEFAKELIALSDASDNRKQQFNFDYPLSETNNIPAAIKNAAEWAAAFKTPTNTAILKKYDSSDTYQSAAFQPHRDPSIYGSQRIVLISLSGEAELTVVSSSGGTAVYPCLPRTAIFVAPHLLHSITEPLNPTGIRHFLFLGYSKTP